MTKCQICKVRDGSEYKVDEEILILCFSCLRDIWKEQGKKPISTKISSEEKEKREEIEFKEKHNLRMTNPEVKEYLNLSGILRNKYDQIIDTYPLLSERQIRGLMQDIHHVHITRHQIKQMKEQLIKQGEIMSDQERKESIPTTEDLKEIRKTGARATAIARSKEKETLTPSEKEFYLGKEKVEETKESKLKRLREEQERGICLNNADEEFLEQFEERENED